MKIKVPAAVLAMVLILMGLTMVRCAKQGTPTGGPKDEEPPAFESAIPPDHTVFFNSEKITITFNEFVQLKNPAKEIFVSPPMKIKPEYKVNGKKVIIEFQEELKENSTYTINFGNAIVDFTEGNPVVNFEYVFSTGEHIDSLSIPGKILNAFDLTPVPEILVMVYKDDNDTIPLDSLPYRVSPASASKTTKEGIFRINNLAAGEYKLFALEDMNNNFIFDLPNERIAFLDSLVTLSPPEPAIVAADSSDTIPSADSTDTIEVAGPSFQILTEDSYTLYLYEEADSTQRLMGKKLIGTTLLQYIFKKPVDSINITPVEFQPEKPVWYMLEYGILRDTLNIWLKDGLPDTIRVCVSVSDSLSDTSRYILSRAREEKQGSRRKGTATQALGMIPNITTGRLDIDKEFTLTFGIPIQAIDTSKLSLFAPTDTIVPSFTFTDSIQRHGKVNYKWVPNETYIVNVDDSAFMDIGGAFNDSTFFRFKVRTAEEYGILIVKVRSQEAEGKCIIQLMTDKDILVEEKMVEASGTVKFENIMPGNYKLKAIHDANSNGKWDPGKYNKGVQPEKVEYYKAPLSIRANWDMQEEWILER
jgi:uncharacterized protein (DUF2141 family)